MAHLHSVYDTDAHFIINPITRLITTTSTKNTLVQGDHNSERFTFEIPRFVEGHDMAACNCVEIHYNNISKNRLEYVKDYYTVTDLQISPDSDDIVIFSWLVSGASTQIVGKLLFSVKFACVSDMAIEEYAWHTLDFTAIKVNEKSYSTDSVLEQHSDFVDRIETLVAKMEKFNDDFVRFDNDKEYIPTGKYNPATKKYADDATTIDDDSLIDMLVSNDVLTAVTDENGSILTDESGNILLW